MMNFLENEFVTEIMNALDNNKIVDFVFDRENGATVGKENLTVDGTELFCFNPYKWDFSSDEAPEITNSYEWKTREDAIEEIATYLYQSSFYNIR